MGVLTKHLFVAPTPPSVHLGGLGELGALELVVLRCLEKKPERRYASMLDLGAEIARVARFRDDGAFTVQPAQPGERRPPRLADDLELPTTTEMRLALARAGIPGRALPAPAVAALIFFCMLSTMVLSWSVLQLRAGISVRAPTSVVKSAVVTELPTSSAPTAEPAPRPTAPVEPITVQPAPPAPRADRAHLASKPLTHVVNKPKQLPASGLSNDPIAKGKIIGNGIVDPWMR
jgi:hypothetical protein